MFYYREQPTAINPLLFTLPIRLILDMGKQMDAINRQTAYVTNKWSIPEEHLAMVKQAVKDGKKPQAIARLMKSAYPKRWPLTAHNMSRRIVALYDK